MTKLKIVVICEQFTLFTLIYLSVGFGKAKI